MKYLILIIFIAFFTCVSSAQSAMEEGDSFSEGAPPPPNFSNEEGSNQRGRRGPPPRRIQGQGMNEMGMSGDDRGGECQQGGSDRRGPPPRNNGSN